MIQLKTISEAVSIISNYQNDLRANVLDLNQLIIILQKFKRVDNNLLRELSVDELFEFSSFVLVEFRKNGVNFFEPISVLKPIIEAIGTDILAFIDFLYCSKNLSFSFFSTFYKLNATIKKELPKILNRLLYYECSFKEDRLKQLLDNIGKEELFTALDSLVKDRSVISQARLQDIVYTALEISCPTDFVTMILHCASRGIELTHARLDNIKTQERCLVQVCAITKIIKGNQEHIDRILSHPNVLILEQLIQHISGFTYHHRTQSFTQNPLSLNLPTETLLKFLHVESIDLWWNAFILLSRHELLTAPAVDELLNNPSRVAQLARMSGGDCEHHEVDNCLYGKEPESELRPF